MVSQLVSSKVNNYYGKRFTSRLDPNWGLSLFINMVLPAIPLTLDLYIIDWFDWAVGRDITDWLVYLPQC